MDNIEIDFESEYGRLVRDNHAKSQTIEKIIKE